MSKAKIIYDGLMVSYLVHIRRVTAVCIFYKIRCNTNPALNASLLEVHVPARLTRHVVSVHSKYIEVLGLAQCKLVGRLFLRVFNIEILWMRSALPVFGEATFKI